MKQINVKVPPEFDRDLSLLMESRAISSKSAAIRIAVAEAAARSGKTDFRAWIGSELKAAPAKKGRLKTSLQSRG